MLKLGINPLVQETMHYTQCSYLILRQYALNSLIRFEFTHLFSTLVDNKVFILTIIHLLLFITAFYDIISFK